MENSKTEAKIPAGGKKIVLVGNPNVGKSVFFNALTGLYVDVSNYPGTTLDMACGRYNGDVVIDTPGVYGVSSFSEEEGITRDIVLAADLVVNVIDAVHLERDLFLTLQVIDMGIPMVVALNMVDEAAREGLKINVDLLEKLLGVPVVSTAVVHNVGIEELKERIRFARPGQPDDQLLKKIENTGTSLSRAEALLVLEGDPVVSERCGVKPGIEREQIYRARLDRASRIVNLVVQETDSGKDFASRLGRLMLRPSTGFPLLLLTLWVIYELVGVFLAQVIVPVTEEFMIEYYEPVIGSLLDTFLPPDSVINNLLTGRFGLLTFTVTYMVGLLLPLVLGIFLVLSVLEDSGYLPRIATLFDRALSFMGLNGQAIIPLILGFGCVTMSIISTRMLRTDRERRIAIFLLALGVPCSAQMAMIMAVLAAQGGFYLLFYLCFMFCILVATGTLLGRFLPGQASPLLLNFPCAFLTSEPSRKGLEQVLPLHEGSLSFICRRRSTPGHPGSDGIVAGSQGVFCPYNRSLAALACRDCRYFYHGTDPEGIRRCQCPGSADAAPPETGGNDYPFPYSPLYCLDHAHSQGARLA